jgi:Ca-activated chloride channel homolog
MQRYSMRARAGAALAISLFAAACGGGGGAATPTPANATIAPTSAATPAATVAATNPSTGAPSLAAAATVAGGTEFEVTWTGPNAQGDYVTIVKAGATKWTNERYFYTTVGSPGKLVAPSTEGAYELWYVNGADDAVLAKRDITVTPFTGDLGAPESVMAGAPFEVAWNGPNGPGDYVTIVKAGATKWTNESYFYTTVGSPGTLVSEIEPGSYEIWYVIGADDAIKARRPITVTPYVVTLAAPTEVAKGAQIQVTWTGPNGPQDYITIVPAGSPPGTYLNYAYTSSGNPATFAAPDNAGPYEIWYASDRVKDVVFQRIPIIVK